MSSVVDHLVYGVPDLEAGMAGIERLLGCDVVPGGRHEDWGTRNALVSLGETCYLEIIGPDPDTTIDGDPVLFGLDVLEQPRLVTWAAKGNDLDVILERATTVGVDLGGVFPGSRQLPDGSVLAWRLTNPFAERINGTVPFFIDWGSSTHPAAMLPPGCDLVDLTVAHPDAARVESVLRAVGIPVEVTVQATMAIAATIQTPNGIINLS